MPFIVEDASGSIQGIIWDDAIHVFKGLTEGRAYTFFDTQVRRNSHSGKLELKIYDKTKIDLCDAFVLPNQGPVKIGDFKSGKKEYGELICKLVSVGCLESTRTNEPMRRAVGQDETGQMNIFMLKEVAKDESFKEGMVVLLKGRRSAGLGNVSVFTSELREVQGDHALKTLFLSVKTPSDDEEQDARRGNALEESPRKKHRTSECITLLEASKQATGEIKRLHVVIKSKAIGAFLMGAKRNLMATVVDASMTSMDICFEFEAKDEIEMNSGDVVTCEASILPGGKLKSSSFEVSKPETDPLGAWFKENETASFLDLTLNSAH